MQPFEIKDYVSGLTNVKTGTPAYTDQREAKPSVSLGISTTVEAKELNTPAQETKSTGYPNETAQQEKDIPPKSQVAIEYVFRRRKNSQELNINQAKSF